MNESYIPPLRVSFMAQDPTWSDPFLQTELSKILPTQIRRKGHVVAQWWTRYATSLKVVGLIPDAVMNFFNVFNSSDRTRPWGLLSL
jgi:hypothetical protein